MKKTKQSLTLIEIMVVITLIGIIGSVLGVNMKKSMDRAKAFKAKAHAQKIEDSLNIYFAENNVTPDEVIANAATILSDSGFFKDDRFILIDPYGEPIEIVFDNGGFVCTKKTQNPKKKR